MTFGSRQKGKAGEREIAKLLQAWWRQLEPECEFASTPLSGGWHHASIRGGMKLSGDLCTTAEQFPFVVEVKRREKWNLDRLLKGGKSPVRGWWKQCCLAALEMGGKPLLIFRKSREPWLVMARIDDLHFDDGEAWYGTLEDDLVICELSHMLKWKPSSYVVEPGGVT